MRLIKIKKLLEEKQRTIVWLSSKIGVTDQTLYNCFKRNSIETKHLEKIAEALETPISYFFEDDCEDRLGPDSSLKGNHNINMSNNTGNIKVNHTLLDCKKEIESLKREIEYLKEINALLKSK